MIITAFLISFLITLYLIPKILLVSIKKRLIDTPNGRKVHTCVSSRLGGVAFLPSIVFAIVISVTTFSLFDSSIWSQIITIKSILCICACNILYLVGVADDIANVRYRSKFNFQIVAAILIIVSGCRIDNLYGILGIYQIPYWAGVSLTILLIVFIINSLNLIDGIDGLASGLSIIATLILGLFFIYDGQAASAILSFSALGTLIAFFRFNVLGVSNKKYKIFMGDAGSLTMGAILSILAITLCQQRYTPESNNTIQFIIAYSLLLVPCFDVVRVVLHRYRKNKPLFSPDKNHIHHKFLALGFSHKTTLIILLAISCLFTLINISAYYINLNINLILLIDIVIWTLIHIVITKRIIKQKSIDLIKVKQLLTT